MSSILGSSPEQILQAGRAQYVTILVTTFAFGPSFPSFITFTVLSVNKGVYIVLVGLSLHYLLRDFRGKLSRGRLFVLGYTWCMLFITCAWYYCVARHFEDSLVERPNIIWGSNGQRFWLAKSYAQNILAAVQFLSCDGLLVRHFSNSAIEGIKLKQDIGVSCLCYLQQALETCGIALADIRGILRSDYPDQPIFP
jgi:hypothetical protein